VSCPICRRFRCGSTSTTIAPLWSSALADPLAEDLGGQPGAGGRGRRLDGDRHNQALAAAATKIVVQTTGLGARQGLVARHAGLTPRTGSIANAVLLGSAPSHDGWCLSIESGDCSRGVQERFDAGRGAFCCRKRERESDATYSCWPNAAREMGGAPDVRRTGTWRAVEGGWHAGRGVQSGRVLLGRRCGGGTHAARDDRDGGPHTVGRILSPCPKRCCRGQFGTTLAGIEHGSWTWRGAGAEPPIGRRRVFVVGPSSWTACTNGKRHETFSHDGWYATGGGLVRRRRDRTSRPRTAMIRRRANNHLRRGGRTRGTRSTVVRGRLRIGLPAGSAAKDVAPSVAVVPARTLDQEVARRRGTWAAVLLQGTDSSGHDGDRTSQLMPTEVDGAVCVRLSS